MIIKNARILPMDQPLISSGYIEFENGIIKSIGSMDECPETREGVDVKGAYVLPGFIDSHCHIGMSEDALDREGDDLNEMTDPVTPQLRGIDAINPMDRCFGDALKGGVTGVLTGPGSANPIGGQFVFLRTLGHRIDEMALLEPACMKFALGENPKRVYGFSNRAPATRMATAATIRNSLTRAQIYMEKKKSGADVTYDPKMEALIPVLEGTLPAHFHAHRADDIFTSIRIIKEFKLKGVLIHCTEGWMIPEELSEANLPIVTGPFLTDRSKPELKNLSIAGSGILSKHGLHPSICTDHPVIMSEHLIICAAMAHREGMDELEALKAITIYAAENAGVSSRTGSLTVGKDADISVWSHHPFDILHGPSMVFSAGRIGFQSN